MLSTSLTPLSPSCLLSLTLHLLLPLQLQILSHCQITILTTNINMRITNMKMRSMSTMILQRLHLSWILMLSQPALRHLIESTFLDLLILMGIAISCIKKTDVDTLIIVDQISTYYLKHSSKAIKSRCPIMNSHYQNLFSSRLLNLRSQKQVIIMNQLSILLRY